MFGQEGGSSDRACASGRLPGSEVPAALIDYAPARDAKKNLN